jgi:hypothetical protein
MLFDYLILLVLISFLYVFFCELSFEAFTLPTRAVSVIALWLLCPTLIVN